MLKIGPLYLLIFPNSGSSIRNPESGKQHQATSGIWNPANLTSGTSLVLSISLSGGFRGAEGRQPPLFQTGGGSSHQHGLGRSRLLFNRLSPAVHLFNHPPPFTNPRSATDNAKCSFRHDQDTISSIHCLDAFTTAFHDFKLIITGRNGITRL